MDPVQLIITHKRINNNGSWPHKRIEVGPMLVTSSSELTRGDQPKQYGWSGGKNKKKKDTGMGEFGINWILTQIGHGGN